MHSKHYHTTERIRREDNQNFYHKKDVLSGIEDTFVPDNHEYWKGTVRARRDEPYNSEYEIGQTKTDVFREREE